MDNIEIRVSIEIVNRSSYPAVTLASSQRAIAGTFDFSAIRREVHDMADSVAFVVDSQLMGRQEAEEKAAANGQV